MQKPSGPMQIRLERSHSNTNSMESTCMEQKNTGGYGSFESTTQCCVQYGRYVDSVRSVTRCENSQIDRNENEEVETKTKH